MRPRQLLRFSWAALWLCCLLGLNMVFATSVLAQSALEDLPIPEDPPIPTVPLPQVDPHGHAPNLEHPHQDDEGFAPKFMRQALLAGVSAALLLSYLGLYVVGRRMVFIGVGLAEMSSAGIALGLMVGFSPLLGALGFMFLGVVLFSRRWAPRRLPGDAVIGVFYLTAIALGILLIAHSPRGEMHTLTLLRGEVLAVYPNETWQMIGVFGVLAAVHALFAKEFLLVSIDRDTAASQGLAASRWEFLLVLTIGIAVSLAIRSMGVLLSATLLVLPAATALLVCSRWKHAVVLAPLLGAGCVTLGLMFSLYQDLPASAVIVALAFTLLMPALLWRAVRAT